MSGRWILEKDVRFEAAHRLVGHDGKCARLHGHSWKGTVAVVGNQLVAEGPKAQMLIDYGDLKAAVNGLVEERLDHYFLNESIPELKNPTSEALAQWFFLEVEKALAKLRPAGYFSLESVTIEETCTARCTYSRERERRPLR